MVGYPFVVLVPRTAVDETTMGEWLEARGIDYKAHTPYPARAAMFEFRFAQRDAADAFAHNFASVARLLAG